MSHLFKSPKTIEALDFVGFCARYGTVDGNQWSYSPNMLRPDEAVEATARLCNICLLQAIVPDWQCDLEPMTADITELVENIERMHGPLDQNAVARAANSV
tara:strand:- start:703 stop:1005 length:303 start_codon:yes stop_codon:yes gene_type:complete